MLTYFFGAFAISLSLIVSQPSIPSHAQPVDLTQETDEMHQTLFLGDVMLGRLVGQKIQRSMDPFEYTYPVTKNYDEVIINLEGPITDTQRCQDKAYSFRFEPEVTSLLKKANVTAASLANNHSFDCFERGYSDTKLHLEAAGITGFGNMSLAGYPVYTYDTPAGEYSIIAVDHTINLTNHSEVVSLIATVSISSDFVAVFVHWGSEYEHIPTLQQRNYAYAYADAGADLIIGHHPHVIQGAERYQNTTIFYSLGNFVFDQLREETNIGYGVSMKTSRGNVPVYSILPYKIIGTQPMFLEKSDSKYQDICEFVQKLDGVDLCDI